VTELETIITNITAAVVTGELTISEAVDLLDDFLDHEYKAAQ